MNEVILMLEKIAPSALSIAKQLVEQEKTRRQREQKVEYQPVKRKKSYDIDR